MISRRVKIGTMVAITGATLVITGTNVLAGLNATVSASQTDNVGTLTLSSANTGTGFTSGISNMAPGDTVNRYVTLTNDGTLDAISLGMKVTATGTASLITDGTTPATNKALTVAVYSCTNGTWTAATGVCSGTTNTEIAATSLSALTSTVNFAVKNTLAAAGTLNLKIETKLPDQNETTANGVPPTWTVQNGSATLSYLFTEVQRTVTTTNN